MSFGRWATRYFEFKSNAQSRCRAAGRQYAEVALARDEGSVGRACERFGRIVDLYALSSGEPVDLQNQVPGVHGRTRPSFALHAIEQLTPRPLLRGPCWVTWLLVPRDTAVA